MCGPPNPFQSRAVLWLKPYTMKVVLLAVAFTTVLFSCQKSKDEPSPAQSDYLGKYKITKLLFQSKGNPDQDLLATLPDCAQDDQLRS